jgi:hypothetical protein
MPLDRPQTAFTLSRLVPAFHHAPGSSAGARRECCGRRFHLCSVGTAHRAAPTLRPDGWFDIYYDRVLATALRYKHPPHDILAYAMAHEVGHVLLSAPGHSSTGIMRPAWDGDDIRRIVGGSLSFTPAQTELIRARIGTCCAGTPAKDRP